jgi:hypothetical protein
MIIYPAKREGLPRLGLQRSRGRPTAGARGGWVLRALLGADGDHRRREHQERAEVFAQGAVCSHCCEGGGAAAHGQQCGQSVIGSPCLQSAST